VSAKAETGLGRIETRVPARLDRLPWSRFHWLIVIGLGTVWILDGLEVTIVGSIASRLTEKGSGLLLSTGQIGTAAAFYVAGACVGALFFGQLTDRFGRKRLFLATLLLYIAATVATAFAHSAAYFFAMRFLTGAGIGGEYAAINSAIDELIPARVRGRVDLIINGSYWVGAAVGAVGALILLNTSIFAADLGWRLAFGIGAVFGLAILLVRRTVPESPRWLFIHGREEEAEQIVESIERDVSEETGQKLPEPRGSIEVQQRRRIPFREIAGTAFRKYPRRTILGLALFVGQAFLYNAITFDLGTLFSEFFDVASGSVPYLFAIFAVANFMGPLLLGRLFDTVGRKPMITATYFGSAVLAVVLAVLLTQDVLSKWSFLAVLCATFFLASAGASSAYLTVSEIFPMETRALAIAFFYAIGTAVGGITGPLLFGHLIASGDASQVAIGFYIGAAVMAIGGIAELLFGVRAERRSLEGIAEPLSARDVTLDEQIEPEHAAVDGDAAGTREHAGVDGDAAGTGEPERRPPPSTSRRQPSRFRLGPGSVSASPGMWASTSVDRQPADEEAGIIARALAEHGPLERHELARRVAARFWGPGRFNQALRHAVDQGAIQRLSRSRYGPGDGPPGEQREPAGAVHG
jgi:MFS family permease